MLQMHEVSVTYPGGTAALCSTSTTFSAGRFTVLLGPSGSGKSTLLRSLNLMVRPNSGHVSVEGLGTLSEGRLLKMHRRHTAMIFQQHQLIARHTVLQNVMVGRLGYHTALRSLFPLPKSEFLIALESLDRVGLLHKVTERVSNLSGGEQQRVGIARALAQKPQIILADEPIASLDPASASNVLSLLHAICKEDGITAVVSLHQVEMARKFADHIIGLASGRIVFEGSPDELTDSAVDKIYNNGNLEKNVRLDSYAGNWAETFPSFATIKS